MAVHALVRQASSRNPTYFPITEVWMEQWDGAGVDLPVWAERPSVSVPPLDAYTRGLSHSLDPAQTVICQN